MRVPLFDGAREFQRDSVELIDVARRILESGRYILGPEVESFEADVGRYVGVEHAVGVASGTDALWLALKAAGVGTGDSVLTTPFTFVATASAIVNAGARPVFCDVDPSTLNLDPVAAEAVLSGHGDADPSAIRAMVPVHLYGRPADMEPLVELARQHQMVVIEDAAQAMGAEYGGQRVGSIGDLGCLSFFPTKNLSGFGDGGLVSVRNEKLADRLRLLRAQGARDKYTYLLVGTNSRLDALQAALLRARLRHLDPDLEARRAHARGYTEALADLDEVASPLEGEKESHTFNQYVIRVRDGARDALRKFLVERGVETAVHYPAPLHLQDALAHLGHLEGDFPHAEEAAREVLSLPIFPTMRREELDYVTSSIRSFFSFGG